jgi:hypothetical protein
LIKIGKYTKYEAPKKEEKSENKKKLPFGATQMFVNTTNAPFFLSNAKAKKNILFVVTLRAEDVGNVLPLIQYKIKFLVKVQDIRPIHRFQIL